MVSNKTDIKKSVEVPATNYHPHTEDDRPFLTWLQLIISHPKKQQTNKRI